MKSSLIGNSKAILNDYKLDGMMMRYSQFVPRLFNYCLSLGMTAGKIMPSRAFCSDESQGYPIILLAKQFGAFPFNHGRVGGIVATDRHGPHASHGSDMMIIQASHVGYEPQSKTFGTYRRIQTQGCNHSTNCGKIAGTLQWYHNEYDFAGKNIFLETSSTGLKQISINSLLLDASRLEGLFLDLDKLIAFDKQGQAKITQSLSTARCFQASEQLIKQIGDAWPQTKQAIAKLTSDNKKNYFSSELFTFKRNFTNNSDIEGANHLEQNLLPSMAWIVTHPAPTLAAAQILSQVEFDRAYRTIVNEASYKNRNLLFISGLNIDISPEKNQIFPLTKFVPWAAYVQKEDGSQIILEQQELFDALNQFDNINEQKIDLEKEIAIMENTQEVYINYDFLNQ